MATQVKRIYSQHGDAIRIVPLHLPDAIKTPTADAVPAAAASPPQLTYRNGPVLTAVQHAPGAVAPGPADVAGTLRSPARPDRRRSR